MVLMNVISNDSTVHMYVFLQIGIIDTFMQIWVVCINTAY